MEKHMSVFELINGISLYTDDIEDSLTTASYTPEASGQHRFQGQYPNYRLQAPTHYSPRNPFIFRIFHRPSTTHAGDLRGFHTVNPSCARCNQRDGGDLSRMEAGALTMIQLMLQVEYKYFLEGGSDENKNFTC